MTDSNAVPEWQAGYNRDDPYTSGLVRVAWAARALGLSFDQRRQEAIERGISVGGGIAWDALIPLATELLIREKDAARRAQIRSGLVTFIEARKQDVAAVVVGALRLARPRQRVAVPGSMRRPRTGTTRAPVSGTRTTSTR